MDRASAGRRLGKWPGVGCQHRAGAVPEQTRVARRFWATNKQSAPFSLFEGCWGPWGRVGPVTPSAADSGPHRPDPAHTSGAAATDRAGVLSCLVKAHCFCSADQQPLNTPFPQDPGAAQDQNWIYQALIG